MRRITIEFGEHAVPGCPFDVVDEYGRRCDGLAFDEMLGQVVSLTHPQLGRAQYQMLTPEDWATRRERFRAAAPSPPIVDTDAVEAMRDALGQWAAAERDSDPQELANARAERDRLLLASADDFADVPF